MALSKRVRFEVFKRDLFQCQYCGRMPPAVVLEVDHIIPQKHGGRHSIDNLLTSCFDCNRGKAGKPLSEAPSTLTDKLAILKEKRAQLKALDLFLVQQEQRLCDQIDAIQEHFAALYPDREFTNTFCQRTLRRFLLTLNVPQIKNALSIAASHYPQNTSGHREQAIRYFCGICWNLVREPGQHG